MDELPEHVTMDDLSIDKVEVSNVVDKKRKNTKNSSKGVKKRKQDKKDVVDRASTPVSWEDIE